MSPTVFKKNGKNISDVEVTHISIHGVWVFINDKEYFLPYTDYPWFKDARISEIHDVRLRHGRRLHWPELDVDLSVESLEHPENYPLVYQ